MSINPPSNNLNQTNQPGLVKSGYNLLKSGCRWLYDRGAVLTTAATFIGLMYLANVGETQATNTVNNPNSDQNILAQHAWNIITACAYYMSNYTNIPKGTCQTISKYGTALLGAGLAYTGTRTVQSILPTLTASTSPQPIKTHTFQVKTTKGAYQIEMPITDKSDEDALKALEDLIKQQILTPLEQKMTLLPGHVINIDLQSNASSLDTVSGFTATRFYESEDDWKKSKEIGLEQTVTCSVSPTDPFKQEAFKIIKDAFDAKQDALANAKQYMDNVKIPKITDSLSPMKLSSSDSHFTEAMRLLIDPTIAPTTSDWIKRWLLKKPDKNDDIRKELQNIMKQYKLAQGTVIDLKKLQKLIQKRSSTTPLPSTTMDWLSLVSQYLQEQDKEFRTKGAANYYVPTPQILTNDKNMLGATSSNFMSNNQEMFIEMDADKIKDKFKATEQDLKRPIFGFSFDADSSKDIQAALETSLKGPSQTSQIDNTKTYYNSTYVKTPPELLPINIVKTNETSIPLELKLPQKHVLDLTQTNVTQAQEDTRYTLTTFTVPENASLKQPAMTYTARTKKVVDNNQQEQTQVSYWQIPNTDITDLQQRPKEIEIPKTVFERASHQADGLLLYTKEVQ